jgi:hypothetical protein
MFRFVPKNIIYSHLILNIYVLHLGLWCGAIRFRLRLIAEGIVQRVAVAPSTFALRAAAGHVSDGPEPKAQFQCPVVRSVA